MNVISRSGTNGYPGNVFLFARDEVLDGRNAFAPTGDKPPFRRRNRGSTLGGPVIRNKTFFFAAVEYTKRNQSDITTISDASVQTINATLAARALSIEHQKHRFTMTGVWELPYKRGPR